MPPFGNPRFCRRVATVRNPVPVSPPLQNPKKRRRPAHPHGLICAASLFGLRAGTGEKTQGGNCVSGLQFSTSWVIINLTRIGGCNTKEVGKRLKALRESIGISQVKMAEAIGSTQSSVNRYENGQSTPPVELFRRYADYFDVSLDYIFARTDKPQGVTYEFKPKAAPEREEMRRFIEMCFDPQSPMNEKLKETLLRMMEGDQ